VILAVINRLSWFAWASAVGTYGFALVLWLLTSQQLRRAGEVRAMAPSSQEKS
jgi:hypothetical protein